MLCFAGRSCACVVGALRGSCEFKLQEQSKARGGFWVWGNGLDQMLIKAFKSFMLASQWSPCALHAQRGLLTAWSPS
jgi:hypothetical protein